MNYNSIKDNLAKYRKYKKVSQFFRMLFLFYKKELRRYGFRYLYYFEKLGKIAWQYLKIIEYIVIYRKTKNRNKEYKQISPYP